MKKYINSFKNFLFLESFEDKDSNFKLISEGGAFGHLSHIFEDTELTFGDMKEIILMLMDEGLSLNSVITEKTDGAQLSFSWKSGSLIAARNKSHLRNAGENALSINDLKTMFKGRGEIENAFVFAINDLSNALSKLNPKQLQEMFEEGRKFMSVEIMYSKSENSIPYNINLLSFHGLISYDETGKPLDMDKKLGIKLAELLKEINANIGETFNISGPSPIEIIKSADFSKKAKVYLSDLTKLQKEYNLTDDNQVSKYHYEWFKELLIDQAKKAKFDISDELLDRICKRFGYQDKTAIKATEFKTIENKDFSSWLIEFNDKEYEKVYYNNIEKFEIIFFKVGVDILKSLSSYLVFNRDQAKSQMKKNLQLAIDTLEKSNDTSLIDLLIKNLKKIDDCGGIDEITPSEGIVFSYKDKLYKITGLFTPFHRIVSKLKF